jgi:glycosyltransferase involved in cell wall biosynthesis
MLRNTHIEGVDNRRDHRIILVFRDHLLPNSETFVRAQGEALKRFVAYYCGSKILANGLTLPADRILTVNRGGLTGKAAEAAFKMCGVAPRLLRRARTLRPVLIHAHFGVDGALALPLARSLQVPLVVTFHGYDATVSDDYARRSFFVHRRFVANRATLQKHGDLFIAVSHFIRRKLIAQGFPEEKTVVHYIGVDLETFHPDYSVQRTPLVLFVGRLVEKKGCAHLIRAVALVQQSAPHVELIIIGDGPLRAELERLANTCVRHCQFLGTQSWNIVRYWMNRAAVFSTPSMTATSGDAEGFGLVFTEAQAMGLPVVSFASGGVPEAVAHGETGLLVNEGDHRALADSILRLLQEPNMWQSFSTAGQDRVRRCFDLRKQTAQLEQLYEGVMAHAS